MNKEKNINTQNLTVDEDYSKNFLPSVHRIGRTSMVVAFLLAMLPVLYLIFIDGFRMQGGYYITAVTSCVSIALVGWLSEPITYWPIMGSAATYMSYLSGNARGVRWPTVVAVQKETQSDASTPRGQVLAIVGVGASVLVNLIILLATVLAGGWLLSVLPDAVVGAFSFSIVAVIAAMLVMRLDLGKGIIKGTISQLPYIIIGLVIKLIIDTGFIPFLTQIGALIAVLGGILAANVIYRRDLAKLEAADTKDTED